MEIFIILFIVFYSNLLFLYAQFWNIKLDITFCFMLPLLILFPLSAFNMREVILVR